MQCLFCGERRSLQATAQNAIKELTFVLTFLMFVLVHVFDLLTFEFGMWNSTGHDKTETGFSRFVATIRLGMDMTKWNKNAFFSIPPE